MITKTYNCPLCKTKHTVKFPKDFAEGRASYPFVHSFIHKYSPKSYSPDTGRDILTMLYIDKNLEIRHVETMFQNAEGNIVSMEDAQKMISFLTQQLQDLQDSYDELLKKYNELKSKNPPSKASDWEGI
ncbi:MAG: hypothetical protein ACTSWC_09385 [Promethearchaeota archaeon]